MPPKKTRAAGKTQPRPKGSPRSKSSAARPSRSDPLLFQDWSEFLRLLTHHRVKFLLIGGHAISIHARPRHTEDLDVLVEPTKANAARVLATFADFGFASVAPEPELLSRPGKVFMLGRRPYRIDVLTKIDGLSFGEAWRNHVEVELAGVTIPVIGRAALIRNKIAAGRPKDLADVAMLAEAADER